MRALAISLLLLLVAVATAHAQDAPTQAVPAPAPAPAVQPGPPAELPTHGRVDGVAIDPANLPITDLDEGHGRRRPSGFWTGYRPARGSPYRWPLVGIAVVTVAMTVLLLRRLIRKQRATAPTS